jgi:hypothetical protein
VRRQLGQAEIEYAHSAVARHDDVVGLQVGVNDAMGVGFGQGVGDGAAQAHGLTHRQGARVEAGAERRAVEVLERQVGATVEEARPVHRDDVRVVEARGGARLVEKPCHGGWVEALDELERDASPQLLVEGEVDLAHGALADQVLDAKPVDGGVWSQAHDRLVVRWGRAGVHRRAAPRLG